MEKLTGMIIGSLFFAMNANAVELGGDVRTGINNAGVDLVLELSGINYSYPETVLKNSKVSSGSRVIRNADPTSAGWSDYPGGYRLTAGMLEYYPKAKSATGTQNGIALDAGSSTSDITLESQNLTASAGKAIPYSSRERSAGRDERLKVAVGVGVTSLEPDIDLEAELNAGSFNGMDHAELAAMLNEAETETTPTDLEDYLVRPVLAIGVNYAF